jgi:hypothetical protein
MQSIGQILAVAIEVTILAAVAAGTKLLGPGEELPAECSGCGVPRER